MKKLLCVFICFLLVFQTLSFSAFSADTKAAAVSFEEKFDYDSFGVAESIYGGANIWQKEYKTDTSNDYGYRESSAPQVENGVLKFNERDGIRLNWQNISGFSYDSTKTYTITFDFKVTDFGDDVPLSGSPAWNREFYFAPAGYYNQIECRSANYPDL